MATRVVRGDVDTDRKTVVLSGEERLEPPPQPGGRSPALFVVEAKDEVEWQFRVVAGGELQGRRLRVRFVGFPNLENPTLFEGPAGHIVESASSVGSAVRLVGGPVSEDAFPGFYTFSVELVGPDTTEELACRWANGPGSPGIPVNPPMGGGEKRGGPG
jgi:hypothetical protein